MKRLANLYNIYETGASGDVVIKLKKLGLVIGHGHYTQYKPQLIEISGRIEKEGFSGPFFYRLKINDENTCDVDLGVKGFPSISAKNRPYDLRKGGRKIIIHDIEIDYEGKNVTGDLTVADANNKASKHNPDFDIPYGDWGIVTRPVEAERRTNLNMSSKEMLANQLVETNGN